MKSLHKAFPSAHSVVGVCLSVVSVLVISLAASGCGGSSSGGGTAPAPSNTAPSIDSMDATPDPVVEGNSLSLSVDASDTDGDTLNYTWEQASGPVFNGLPATGDSVSLNAPSVSSSQTATFEVEVYDGEHTVNDTITVTVDPDTSGGGGGGGTADFRLLGIAHADSEMSVTDTVEVDTKVSNQLIRMSGDFDEYDLEQHAVEFEDSGGNTAAIHSLVYTFASGTRAIVDLPRFDSAGVYSVHLHAYDTSTHQVIDTATEPNGLLQLDYASIGKQWFAFDGEDGNSTNDGRVFGGEVDANGNVVTTQVIQQGNGHINKPDFLAAGDSFIFAPANNGFTPQLYKLDVTKMSVQQMAPEDFPSSSDVVEAAGTRRNGNPVVLTQAPSAHFTVWEVASDFSGQPTPIALNDTGEGVLAAGTEIAGFEIVYDQKDGQPDSDYALIAAGNGGQALFIVDLNADTYQRVDLNGFEPKAMDVNRDPPTGMWRVDMVSHVNQHEHMSVLLDPVTGPNPSTVRALSALTNTVTGLHVYWDEANERHLAWVCSQGVSTVDAYDLSKVDPPIAETVGTAVGASCVDSVGAPGLDGFVVGYSDDPRAGAMFIKWDGSFTRDIPLTENNFDAMAAGSQAVVIEDRYSSAHDLVVYHGPTDTNQTVGAPVTIQAGGMTGVLTKE